MFLSKNEDGVVDLNAYEPKVDVKRTFKITIEEVVRKETDEMETKYVNKKTGEVISSYDHGYDDKYKDIKDEFQEVELPTGKRSVNTRETKIYEQEKDDIDISDIAMYINRAK